MPNQTAFELIRDTESYSTHYHHPLYLFEKHNSYTFYIITKVSVTLCEIYFNLKSELQERSLKLSTMRNQEDSQINQNEEARRKTKHLSETSASSPLTHQGLCTCISYGVSENMRYATTQFLMSQLVTL